MKIKARKISGDIAEYERRYREEGPSNAMLDQRVVLANYWSQFKLERQCRYI